MSEVPAPWLIWFHNEVYKEVDLNVELSGERSDVYEYCRSVLQDLQQECPQDEILGVEDLKYGG